MRLSNVLYQYGTMYGYWCPGCKSGHHINVGGSRGPQWTFDGNVEAPTFAPSVRHFYPAEPAQDGEPARPERTFCHYFVRAGQIEYQNDCTHALNGQKVPMEPVPDDWGWDGFR